MAKDKAADGGIAQIVRSASVNEKKKKSGALIVSVLGKNGYI